MPLKWYGARIVAKAAAASKLAIDTVTSKAVQHAKENHPWENKTGILEGSLRMEPAQVTGTRVVGYWGSFDVNYALWLEIGTVKMPPFPYLRPAADATYHEIGILVTTEFRAA